MRFGGRFKYEVGVEGAFGGGDEFVIFIGCGSKFAIKKFCNDNGYPQRIWLNSYGPRRPVAIVCISLLTFVRSAVFSLIS